MHASNALAQLHTDYAALALRPATALTPDRHRSLLFYRGDLALRARTSMPSQTPARVFQWLQTLAELEAFIAGENRWPRENRRLDRAAISAVERRLAIWVRTQRTAVGWGARCEYQIRRLACIPGFHLHPLDDRWHQHVSDYRTFTDTWRRPPLVRSVDEAESRLAAFATKQRFNFRNGRLSPDRIAALKRLEFWTWGSWAPPS